MLRFHRRRALLAAFLFLCPATRASAQRGGTIEIVPLARYTLFYDSLALKNTLGVGLGVGIYFVPTLALELAGSYAETNRPDSSRVTVLPWHARLVAHLPLRPTTSALLGLGYSRYAYGDGLDAHEDGLAALAGLRFSLAERLGFRLEGTADYIPSPTSSTVRVWTFGLQAGISILAGPLGPGDTDSDGILNQLDRCPGTPVGERVDPTGCPLPRDADGDGVLDTADRCPESPPGQRVDLSGCNADLDGDGVGNARDHCPATPAGVVVDDDGCPPAPPPADTDGDGVPDSADRCPATPRGGQVDAVGCSTLFEPSQRTLVLHGVTFASGSARLSREAEESLRETAMALIQDPDTRVEVAGHTDSTGSRRANIRLSRDRARSVRTYLVSAGVPADRLTTAGYGPDDPIASNGTADGRAANRRVELRRRD
jgi:outer membrane protein OmpA-like peptidoglycan-associated protein